MGIGADLIATAFRGTTSRVAGLSFAELASETLAFHSKAFPELSRSKLEFMGFVQYRTGGEYHLNQSGDGQGAAQGRGEVQGPGYDHFSTYKTTARERRPVTALRDLLEFKCGPIPHAAADGSGGECR